VHVPAAQLLNVTNERRQPPTSTATRGGEHLQAYTVEQVAEMLHIGRDKVYYLLRTGQLRSIKIGKLRRITNQHLAEFVASLEGDFR
jgi:excisionase family DNA binding protein